MKVNSNESSLIDSSDILHTQAPETEKFFLPNQIKPKQKKNLNLQRPVQSFLSKKVFFAIPNVNFSHMKLCSYCIEKSAGQREEHAVLACIS